MSEPKMPAGDFDRFKDSYRDHMVEATRFAGSDPDYFTEYKASHLLAILEGHFGPNRELSLLDLGCGIGLTDSLLIPHVGSLHGVDIAPETIEVARQRNPSGVYRVYDGHELPFPDAEFDAAFAICVFHHVPPDERPALVAEMKRSVRPGGLVAIYEHNPYHPLTRFVVSRCAFDEDAILLPRRETRALLAAQGLRPVASPYILFSPWRLPIPRAVERGLGKLPVGAQYCVAAAI